MKLIIAGSRGLSPTIEDIDRAFHEFLRVVARDPSRIWRLADVKEVVSGTAAGADLAGEAWAEANGIPVKRFPAAWARQGKAAGKLRNRVMAEYADAAIVFWDGMSPGSCDMVTRMVARQKPVYVARSSR